MQPAKQTVSQQLENELKSAESGKIPEPKPVQRVPPQPQNPEQLPNEESEEDEEEEEEEKPPPKPQPLPEPPKEKPEDLFDLGEPMPSEMPMHANDEGLPIYGPMNRPDGWMTPPPKKPDVWLNPSEPPPKATPGPEGWRSSSPIPPTQQQPPPRKVPVRVNNDPVTHRFKRYVRVPRPVRAQKPPEPVWEHNPPPAAPSPTRPVFGPESRPPGYVSPKPPTPPRRSPVQRQTSDVATLTDVESPVRKPVRNTPPRKRSPPKVLLPPAPTEPPQTVSLDPDDEMFWRSSWQDKNAGKQEVSGLLAYTAEDRSPVQQEVIPPRPKCVYHPDCDGNCQ